MSFLLSSLRSVVLVLFTAFVSALEILAVPFHRTGKIFHQLARFHARGTLALAGAKLTVAGTDRLDLARNYVYVSNHASLFDIPIVLAGIPQDIRLIYKKELHKVPFLGWGLKLGKTYIAIDRGQGADAMQTIEDTARKIREGSSVLMFAEGTRSPDGRLQAFKRGPFNLAAKAGIPVVPVTIKGSHNLLPRDSWKITPGRVALTIDAPIAPAGADGRDSELRLRDDAREVIQRNLERN